MSVYIAEKPGMAMDIARALGRFERRDGYFEVGDDIVTFAVGHLLSQATPEAYGPQFARDCPWSFDVLPIVPDKWLMEVNPKTKDQLRIIGSLLKGADSVVNCGDAAREGQMIVDEILEHFRFKGSVRRLWLQSMTPDSIRKALKQMKDNAEYANLMASAKARSRCDWLTGMNLTRAFTIPWKRGGNSGALHIGRVKTPTLSFVVERELAIRNFVPKDYYLVRCDIEHENGTFAATWQPAKDSDFFDDEGRIVNQMTAETMATWFDGMPSEISKCETTAKSTPPPLPFSLGDLQKAANNLLGLSPSQTLEVAQSLYEKHKLTSYPRTDYNHLPEEEHKIAPQLIEAAKSNYGSAWPFKGAPDFSLKSPAWNSKKIGDHHAIRPTETRDYDLSKLSKNELAVYRLVVRNFLAQFYPNYRYDATSVEVDCDGERLVATGQRPTDAGWRVLFGMDEDDSGDAGPALPKMNSGDMAVVGKASVETKTTTPPPRFTGATLIDAMERAHLFVADVSLKASLKGAGIGTPATRAAIVDELVSQGYLETVKKHYHPTERAMGLYQVIPDALRKPDSTARIEDTLKRIEAGEVRAADFLAEHITEINRIIDQAKTMNIPKMGNTQKGDIPKNGKAGPPCPKCGGTLIERKSARGPFLGCASYPVCKHTQNIEAPAKRKTPTQPKKQATTKAA